MIVEGQVHGGIAQGIGQALLEHGIYDETGQLITGSFMDYCMPRADDLPNFIVDTTVTRVHAQSARRERLRRSRRHRRAGGDHERGDGCDRRQRRRDAGHTRTGLARVQGGMSMYSFNYHRPTTLDAAAKLRADCEDAVFLAGGQTLIPTLKQRLAAPTDSSISAASRDSPASTSTTNA